MTQPFRELTEAEYAVTFSPRMEDVTEVTEEIVDVWSYLDPVLQRDFPDSDDWPWAVKHIYESRDHVYQHLWVPVPRAETYLIVVVDVQQREIVGHYLMDFVEKYGSKSAQS